MTINDLISQPLAYGLDLDSDQIEAALAAADLNPQTCTSAEALTACQEYANAVQAFGQFPTRSGRAADGRTDGRTRHLEFGE